MPEMPGRGRVTPPETTQSNGNVALRVFGMVPAGIRRHAPQWVRRAANLAVYSRHTVKRPLSAVRYLVNERETNNFTYNISNQVELAEFVAGITGSTRELALGLFEELEHDDDLFRSLHERLRGHKNRHPYPRFGRRIVWYALVRTMRPRLVIETGVHDGLGSAAILRALQHNRDEGAPGRLLGTDVDPNAGWLVPPDLEGEFTLALGDSLTTLGQVDEPVGIFIHDSDHHYEYELAEYRVVASRLEPTALLVSDNSHECHALMDYARASGRDYAFCQEVSTGHFYHGAGVGVSAPAAAVAPCEPAKAISATNPAIS